MTAITVPVSTIITVAAKCGAQPGMPEYVAEPPELVAGKTANRKEVFSRQALIGIA